MHKAGGEERKKKKKLVAIVYAAILGFPKKARSPYHIHSFIDSRPKEGHLRAPEP